MVAGSPSIFSSITSTGGGGGGDRLIVLMVNQEDQEVEVEVIMVEDQVEQEILHQ
jgi:hypothetical protein